VQIRLKFNFDILFFSNNLSLIIVAILMNNQQAIYGIAAIKPFLKSLHFNKKIFFSVITYF
jgi:predicted branched-subunit amino acid permease